MDIYLYDLGTDTEHRLTSDGQDHINPDIDNGRIVWTGTVDSSPGLLYYDLWTSNLSLLSRNIYRFAQPRIHGNNVVWHSDVPNNIYLYDLATSKETKITNADKETTPAVYGDRIVFEDRALHVEQNILYWNTTQSGYVEITKEDEPHFEPEIHGDRIVWYGQKDGNLDIYIYDLNTNLDTRITTNVDFQTEPAIFGDLIVWEDHRNGNWDIFMMILDRDNDGVSDDSDAFPYNPCEFMDFDLDGIGDNADPDDDNDGAVDTVDDFPYDPFEWNDFDGDGMGDNFDPDDDNDGLIDTEDADPLNQINALYYKLDEIILRIIHLHTDLADRLDVLQHGIMSKLADINDTIQEELKESLGDILEKLLSMETSIQNVEDDLNDEESYLIQRITECKENLSDEILDIEELIDMSFSLLNGYIELINRSVAEKIDDMGSDMETVLMNNLSEIQDTLTELLKINEIIDDIEKIDQSLDVQQESIDDSGSSNNLFFIVLIILLTLYSAILLVALFKDKVFAGFGEKDKKVERW